VPRISLQLSNSGDTNHWNGDALVGFFHPEERDAAVLVTEKNHAWNPGGSKSSEGDRVFGHFHSQNPPSF
jgi:hypothetical protein